MLRRIVGLPCAVADDVLRMEFGCRPYASWMSDANWSLPFGCRLWPPIACPPGWRPLAGRPAVAVKGAQGRACALAWWLPWSVIAVDLKVMALAATGMDKAAFKNVPGRQCAPGMRVPCGARPDPQCCTTCRCWATRPGT